MFEHRGTQSLFFPQVISGVCRESHWVYLEYVRLSSCCWERDLSGGSFVKE